MPLLSIPDLQKKANLIRKDIITMIATAGSGHPGGSLSAVEIVTALYFAVMSHDPKNPDWPMRDRFVLSKGHACPLLYAVLAEAGYLEKDLLLTLRKLGSPLQGHPDQKRLPLLEASTGSLGQGLSIGIGIALAGNLDGKGYRVYVLLGDGECDEGQVWEAAFSAGFRGLDNLTAIVDCNRFQLDGATREILDLEPLKEKWEAARWHALPINGHDFQEILSALEEAKKTRGKPTVIVARTIKGKGVSFMENNNEFHGAAPSPEQARQALEELERELTALQNQG